MKLNKPLTKENFWNEVYEKYPNATKLFCDWIDEYKMAVNWINLFNGEKQLCFWSDRDEIWKPLNQTIAPKFHDLPYAIQQGIWIEFANHILYEYFEQPEYEYNLDLEEDIKLVLSELEKTFT